MKKSKSKYLDTARRMDEAFLALLEKKDFEYITVKEICQAAGVNRSTFYLHYETVNDLLVETTEYFSQKFFSYFEDTAVTAEYINSAPVDELFLITPEYLKPWLLFIQENKRLYKTVVLRYKTVQLSNSIVAVLMQVINPILSRYQVPSENREYIMSFYFEGLNGIVKEWLKNDCQKDIDEVMKIITDCIKR